VIENKEAPLKETEFDTSTRPSASLSINPERSRRVDLNPVRNLHLPCSLDISNGVKAKGEEKFLPASRLWQVKS
jgi:hypothetical protein